MFMDIVLPGGNEQDFIGMARRLSLDALLFLYPKKRKPSLPETDFPVYAGRYVEGKECVKLRGDAARYEAALAPEKLLPVLGRGAADSVWLLETLSRTDHLHYRRSGLNQVSCALARDKEVHIGISLRMLLTSRGWRRAKLLGRISQNLRFCRKFGTQMAIASFARGPWELWAPAEIKSLLLTLGAEPGQANAVLEATSRRIKRVDAALDGKILQKDIQAEYLEG